MDESTIPLTIYDHKTTSSLAYAKTVDDLLNDPQATLYARALMDSRGLDSVRLRWTYATRKGRTEVLPVEVVVTRDDINLRLRPKILDLKPGTRIVSHSFTMEDWRADECQSAGPTRVENLLCPVGALC